MPNVHAAVLAGDRSVEQVARIELNSRLSRPHGQRSTAPRIGQHRRVTQRARRAVDDPVVIVPAAVPQLLVDRIDACANHGGGPEIEWRVRHRRNVAGRDESLVHRRVMAGR
jgi:hypothetical protein